MKKIKGIRVECYDAEDGFEVEVTETENMFEARLRRIGEEYGDRLYMFGSPKAQYICGKREVMTKAGFLDLVEGNLDAYEALYDEDMEDD